MSCTLPRAEPGHPLALPSKRDEARPPHRVTRPAATPCAKSICPLPWPCASGIAWWPAACLLVLEAGAANRVRLAEGGRGALRVRLDEEGHQEDHGDEEAQDDGEEGAEG